MKRLLPLLLLLICFVQTSDARMNAYIAGSVASAASACTTTADDQGSSGTYIGSLGNATIYKRGLEWITGATEYDLCKVDIWMKKVQDGTLNGTVSVSITEASGGSPSTVLGTATETLTQADLTTSCTKYTFTFASPITLQGSTAYYVVVSSDTLNDASNYFAACYLDGGTDDLDYYESSWATGDPTITSRIITYK